MGMHHLDKYMHLISTFDLPEAQKRELLEAVWQIAQSFVDRAHNVDPTQISLENQKTDSSAAKSDSLYSTLPHKNKHTPEGGPKI